MLPAVAFVLSLLVWSAPGFACAPPVERAVYRIEHEKFGDIGRQVLTFRCDGDRLVVDTTVDVAVRMLFFTIYRHGARYRGVWQGDRLVRFESHTDDNGKILEVFARAAGGHVIIDGPNGQSEAPLTVVPNHPWNYDVIARRTDGGRFPGDLGGAWTVRAEGFGAACRLGLPARCMGSTPFIPNCEDVIHPAQARSSSAGADP